MATLTDKDNKLLAETAKEIRKSIIKMLVKAGSGHSAGPLGMADIFSALYFKLMKHDPARPHWDGRDRLILSNGHICPVYYATLAHAGYFPVSELQSLRKFGSRLQGHPHREFLPAVENSSGPLGSGLSQAVGMALADKMTTKGKSDKFFYCLMSDGELDAGNTWEAVMLAGREKLHNLIAIVDRNNIQIDGFTENVMPLEPLFEKWRSFKWHVLEIDGHNFESIAAAVGEAQATFEAPSVIIAHTIPGRGVSFMERKFEWHGKTPKPEEAERALLEIERMK